MAQGEVRALKKNVGAKNIETTEIVIPDDLMAFKSVSDNPELLVAMLKDCGGDVGAFLNQFTSTSGKRVEILTQVICTLRNDKALWKKWTTLIEAHNQAKIMIAQNKAFDCIADYELPSNQGKRKLNITNFVTLARFWLSGHTASEAAKGKLMASPQDAATTPSLSKLETLAESLQDDSLGDVEASDTDY